jgi:acetyl esterase
MLHPQARALLDLMVARGIPPVHTLSPADARRFYLERRHITQPAPPEMGMVRQMQCDGPHGPIGVRLYRPIDVPATATLPVLVYFHGGGWVIGDLDTHDTLCRELATGAGIAVISIDYRLAPEHRFPRAADDCIAATRWVHAQALALGVDATRIAVGGDSAGGNLAAVVALAARDTGDVPIAFQLLIYPATDQRRGAPSHTRNGDGYLLTRESMDYYHDHYLPDATDDLDWRASPLLHADHSRLPPALVLTAGYDPLRDEGIEYAQALTRSGSRAVHISFERQIHGFITMGKVIDEANAAVAICAAQLRQALAG